MNRYQLVLASNSPRRQELLKGLDVDFTVKVLPDLDESYPDGLSGEEIALHIAASKAEAYKSTIAADELVITADTIVWLAGEVLGKPTDVADAKRMLHRLSGKTHQVVTGVCLTTTEWQRSFAVTTEVTFSQLSGAEIEYYVDKYQPMDKAGAYGIQEWIGFVAVEDICGSYFNVMGLPVQRLYKELCTLIWDIP